MVKSRIADKTVVKSLGFCGCGLTSNPCYVDVLDGRAVRIRPLQFGDNYTKEELRYYTIEKDGHVFEPGWKSLVPPLSLAYKNRTYSKNRIPYPLIREDWDPDGERNPQNRGISKYRRISWDEATDIVAREIKRIDDTYGIHSIYCQGDGHGESKNYNGSHGCQLIMFSYIGNVTICARQPDSWEGWYWGAKYMWGMEPVGQNLYGTNVFKDIGENGDSVLFWGADPETTPWGWGGLQASRMCFWFNEIGIDSIFICPDVNYASACHADKWIPVLPNTDAAFQLAIAYVWLNEGLYDQDYIETHTVGFDWFEYHVLGRDDGIPKTPEWAEEKCGVKAYRIKAFARYWAKRNVSIAHCNGGGYIRSVFSHEPARLEVALLGMQAVGKPGANQFKFLEWWNFGTTSFYPIPCSETVPSMEALYHGWNQTPEPPFITKTKVPDAILNPPVSWYGHTGCMYPTIDQFHEYSYPLPGDEPLHMIWTDAPCFSTCWNGGNRYQDALRHESIEFVLVQHPWMENDTMFSDIILPVSTLLECEDLGVDFLGGQFNLLYYEGQACDPVGETISDYACVGEIAKKLEEFGGKYEDLYNKYTKNKDQEEWLQFGVENSGVPDVSLEDLREKNFWASPIKADWESEPVGMSGFYADPENNRLQTPSGKIEYYSARLAEHFPDDVLRGPYPKWVEESEEHKERISSDRAKDYPFLLVSNHPRWRVHAQCDDIPWLREIENTCKVKGPDDYLYEPLWINPIDAEKYGLKAGDVAAIYNERGTVLGGIYVTERIMPGALYQDHGARVDSIVGGTGGLDRGGANNLICPSATSSPNAAGEVTNGFLVGLKKVDAAELANQYPEQFSRDYDSAYGQVASAWIVEGEKS
jgi:trimethylamine-N-oxide reductase (cytochrome c)